MKLETGYRHESYFIEAIDNWVQSKLPDAAFQSQRLLKKMTQLKLKPHVPSLVNYNPEEATHFLNNMMQQYANGNGIIPHIEVFCQVLNAWANSDEGENAVKISLEVFDWLKKISLPENERNEVDIGLKPNTKMYNILINVWAKSGLKGAPLKSEELLRSMVELYEQGCSVKPNKRSYTSVIYAWGKSEERDGAERAENLLQKMLSMYKFDNDFKPSIKTWSCVMDAWVRRVPDFGFVAVQNAYDIFRQMQEFEKKESRHGFAFSTDIYNTLLSSMANSRHKDSIQIVEEILCEMESYDIDKDIFTFNSLLTLYSNFEDREKIELILDRMKSSNIDLDIVTFNIILNFYCKNGTKNDVEDVIERMESQNITPNHFFLTTLFYSYVKFEDVDKAKEIMKQMTTLDMPLNTAMFNRILNYYVKYRAENKMEEVLNEMKLLDISPDNMTFNIVLNFYVKHQNLKKAEELVENMEMFNVPLNIVTCNTLLNLYAKQKEITKAEMLLNQMKSSNISRDCVTFNTLLNLYANCGNAIKAYSILLHMEQCTRLGHPNIFPCCKSYTTVIKAYSQSLQPGMARNAYRVFKRMLTAQKQSRSHELLPNVMTYHSLIFSFLNTFEIRKKQDYNMNKEINEVLLLTTEFMNYVTSKSQVKSNKLDQYHYSALLKLCKLLFSVSDTDMRKKTELLKMSFLQCCQDGCVNSVILNQFNRIAPSHLRDQFFKGKNILKVIDLPKQWTFNCKESRSFKRK